MLPFVAARRRHLRDGGRNHDPFSTHPRLTEEGRENVFRLIGRDDDQGKLAPTSWPTASPTPGLRSCTTAAPTVRGWRGRLAKQLRARGKSEVMYVLYKPHASDYADLLARLQQAQIDVLYVGGYGRDAGLILRTARELGDDLQLIGGDGISMDGFWSIAGDLGERTIFSDRPEARHRPDAAALIERFQGRGLGTRMGGLPYATMQV